MALTLRILIVSSSRSNYPTMLDSLYPPPILRVAVEGRGGSHMEKSVDERVRKVLETIEVERLESLTRAGCVRALGRLLAVKAPRGKPSTYEVTKEVRRALQLVLESPLKGNIEDAIEAAVFMDAPFDSAVLNSVYRLLLERLLRKTVKETADLTPMWRMRLLNLMIENIYNVATTEGCDYVNKIFKALEEGKAD